jgi:hypothetical protein
VRVDHLFTAHPVGMSDVYAAVLRAFPFRACVHVNYQQTVLPMKDGAPKFKDLPKEMGAPASRCLSYGCV